MNNMSENEKKLKLGGVRLRQVCAQKGIRNSELTRMLNDNGYNIDSSAVGKALKGEKSIPNQLAIANCIGVAEKELYDDSLISQVRLMSKKFISMNWFIIFLLIGASATLMQYFITQKVSYAFLALYLSIEIPLFGNNLWTDKPVTDAVDVESPRISNKTQFKMLAAAALLGFVFFAICGI